MATSKAQRVGIWVIAVVMAVGTIGSFFVIILANDNAKVDQDIALKQQEEYNKVVKEYQEKIDAQNKVLTAQYFGEFSGYASQVTAFDKDSVKELATEDLKIGDGEEIKEGTKYSAYYIGWNPDGEVFDQSIDGDKLKSPIPGGGLIEGWNKGVIGMKIGGVRVLTIPSDLAYKEAGSGDKIPPNTPLKFVVFAITTPEEVPIPDLSGTMK